MTYDYKTYVRERLRVGDMIGCRGTGLFSRAIRLVRGGDHDLSHVAIVITDAHNSLTGKRVRVAEAIGGGLTVTPLSKFYAKEHGELSYMPMDNTMEQQQIIFDLANRYIDASVGYDWRDVMLCAIKKPSLNVRKFFCSEFWWYLQVMSGRVEPRFDPKRPLRQIAPVPGDCPTWAHKSLYEFSM